MRWRSASCTWAQAVVFGSRFKSESEETPLSQGLPVSLYLVLFFSLTRGLWGELQEGKVKEEQLLFPRMMDTSIAWRKGGKIAVHFHFPVPYSWAASQGFSEDAVPILPVILLPPAYHKSWAEHGSGPRGETGQCHQAAWHSSRLEGDFLSFSSNCEVAGVSVSNTSHCRNEGK